MTCEGHGVCRHKNPGGWSRALAMLGARDVGLEWDVWACKTRAAAGQSTIRTDVALYPTWPWVGRTQGLIASPPCQAWSMAGRRLGLVDQPLVHESVEDLAAGRDSRQRLLADCRDERSLLAAEPMRYLHALNVVGEPEWVAMEEVPDVLPLWKQYAQTLRTWGFSTWAGILNTADYGIPQTRRRAILLASRTRPAMPPEPTHAQVAEPEGLFGPGREQWVSMAQALGWGATDRPVPTVCAGGGPGGGPEPFPSGSRKTLADARARGTWKQPSDRTTLPNSRPANGDRRPPRGTRVNRPAQEPASTCTTGASRWAWPRRSNNQAHATIRSLGEPAGTLFFGHRAGECVWAAEPADDSGAQCPAPEAIRITPREAGLLQTFPADYPWAGNKSQIFAQIGNSVPPRFAAHLLAPHLEKVLTTDDCTLAA